MIDLEKLQHTEFETLVGLLLKREGHQIVHGPGAPGTRGPDFETVSPEGRPVVVEVKHFNFARGVGKSLVMQFVGDLERYRQQKQGVQGLLVVSSPLSAGAMEAIAQGSDIAVWDREVVSSHLAQHQDLESVFHSAIESKRSFESKVESLMEGISSRTDELSARLRALPCGRDTWREYERICTEILTYVFTPDLAAPDIQSRSDDGLDIIDAIFPIRSNLPPWSLVRSEYRTRFAVAEFKNYCDPIGQAQVESIAQYLWRPAQRFFGLLASRSGPSASAIAQRRRKWLEEEKCIVFLSDDELCEMLQLREAKGQPFDVIDTQLEDFFRTLTP
jgi:hypothetical protein